MGLRFLIFILLFLYIIESFAVEARVLVDDQSLTQEVTGTFTLSCLPVDKKQVCKERVVEFTASHWLIERYYNRLRIKNLKSGKKYLFKGRAFKLQGQFKLKAKSLKQLRLFFIGEKTHWVIHLPVDQYLYGVMGAEVPSSWPQESLKSQAIASRTYFLFKKMERIKKHFDVRSDVLDQVFSMQAQKHKSIIKAVDSTHGLILVSKKKEQIFPAYFHSDCGGHTSSEKLVWRKPAALNQEVKDPYCQTASKNNWSYLIDKEKLMAVLQKVFYLPKGVVLKSILPRTSEESRAHIVDFLFSGDLLKRMSANDLRKVLGFGKLKSTHFKVKDKWNEVVFSGRGFGHGVGMCQWGAQRWARKGKSFKTILKHYYPKAKIRKMDAKQFESLAAQLVY